MPRSHDWIHAVTAADENYALPLAVMVRSALDSLCPDRRLKLYIIDGGITAESKERLLHSWADSRLAVEWLVPDLRALDDLPVSGHVTRIGNARLLLPLILPQDLERVLYLDSDLLVLRDIGHLWDEPVGDAACLGCADVAAPFIDARSALPNYSRCARHLVAATPIPNFRQLGLDPRAKYFNSGVLHINLRRWRREGIAQQALDCLHLHRAHLVWEDQYALNVVLHGRWRQIDTRWNQGAHIYRYPKHSRSPFDKGTFHVLRTRPWIVHFTSSEKPWHFQGNHPFRRHFYSIMERTLWHGWRPETPYHNTVEWLGYHCDRYRQSCLRVGHHWRRRLARRLQPHAS